MQRGLLLGLLVTGCAAQRFELARSTGAAAMGCPANQLWVIVDDEGWMTAGCGQVATGREVSVSAWHGPMTCALQARFDYRLCMSMAKQGAGMTPMTGFGASMREGAGARDCRQAFEGQHAQCAPVPVAPRVEPPPAEPPAPL